MQKQFLAALQDEIFQDFAPTAFCLLKICRDCGCRDRATKIERACRAFGPAAVAWREIFGFPWPPRATGEAVPLEIQIVLDAAFEYHTMPSPGSWRALIQAADRYREANTPC